MARCPAAPVLMRVPSISQSKRRFCTFVIPSGVSRTRNVVEELLDSCKFSGSERFLDFARNDRIPRPHCPIADGLSSYRACDDVLARAGTCGSERWTIGS